MERVEVATLADQAKDKRIAWALPTICDAVFLILLSYLTINGQSLLVDADTGWHIGIGRYILETASVPRTGIFSYTGSDMPWMAHEWLTELIFAGIHGAAGLNGIVLFAALFIAVTHSMFYKFLLYRGVNPALSIVLTVFVITVTSVHWLARPHIISMLIMLVWYIVLERYRLEGKRYIYALPFITILWVNLHGGFMAGIMIAVVYWLGSLLDFLISKETSVKEKSKKDLFVYGKISLMCIAASLANPHTYNALLFPFQVMAQKVNVDRIAEWASPNFHGFLPFEYMLLALIVVLGFSRFRFSFTEAGLVVLWTHLSLHSVRYGPLFAIVLTPIMAVRLEGLMKDAREAGNSIMSRVHDFSEGLRKTSESLNGNVLPLIAVTIAAATVFNGGTIAGKPLMDYGFDKKKFPIEAVEFAERNKIKGNIFNAYYFGGYLIYEGFPKEGVFVDGRADMYNEFMKNYYDVVDLKPGWKEILEKFDINWMLISANSSLSVLLLETDEWHLVYADKVANIFVKNVPENRPLIDKYQDVKLVEEEDDNGSK